MKVNEGCKIAYDYKRRYYNNQPPDFRHAWLRKRVLNEVVCVPTDYYVKDEIFS